jgi:hypothetical protein
MDYYVLRTNGAITGLLSQPPKNGEPVELLPDSNPEVVAYLATVNAVHDQADLDYIGKAIKSLALVTLDYAIQLRTEIRGLATLLVNKALITAAEANALTQYTGSGAGNTKTVANLKADFTAKFNSLP